MACDLGKYAALVDTMLANDVSFAIVRRPGHDECELIDSHDFITVPWRGGPDDQHFSPLPQPSTDLVDYRREVQLLAWDHRRRGGKTVISRVFDVRARIDIPEVARQYFDRNPNAMCALFNTPNVGCWLVASPEILVSVHNDDLQTMALAGTRPVGTVGEWDEKNKNEQQLVSDFIKDVFDRMGIPYISDDPVTLQADGVEHICTRFDARLPRRLSARQVADALNPTPALCGTPRHTAMFEISVGEKHRRQMYGGYFAVQTPDRFDAYVMVRCARLWADGANVFAGGGITASSDPDAEWHEAEMKAAPLLKLIKQNSIKHNDR